MKYPSPRISIQISRRYVALFGLMLLLFFVCLFGLGSQNSTAQASGNARPPQTNIKFTTRILYNGDFKFGNWLPVEVTLQNDGTATTVQVEATVVSEYSSAKLTSNYKRTVTLDQRTSKKVILYVHPFAQNTTPTRSIGYQLEVRLTSNGDILDRQNVQIQPIDNSDFLVGMIGVKLSSANLLDNTRVGPVHSRVTTAVFNPQDLPDRAEGLGSFDALVLSNVSTDGLSKEQQTALKGWISSGGTLILMGGTGWSKIITGLDSTLLPFQVYDYANTKDVNALAEMLGDKVTDQLPFDTTIARGQILQGATPLAIGGGNNTSISPLAAQRLIGNGRVVALAADLTVPPLTDWKETTRLWQSLFYASAPLVHTYNSDNSNQYNAANNYFNLVSNLPTVELPDLMPFFIIVLIYVIAIGPLNYFGLKRIKRLSLAWITIPLSVLIFTGAVLLLFVKTQAGGQVLVNQLSVINADATSDINRIQSYVAIFSPQDKNYQVKMNLPGNANFSLYTPLLHQTSIYAQPESPHNIVEDGREAGIENLHIGQWSVQGFSMSSNLSGNNYKLKAELYFQDGAIVGNLQNNSNQKIKDAMLVYGEQLVRIKDLGPGETIQVKLPLISTFDNSLSYCSSSYSNYNTYSVSPVADKITNMWQTASEDKDLQSRVDLLKRLFQDGDIGPLNTQRGLDLVGWVSDTPATVDLGNFTVQAKTHQLLIESLPVSAATKQGDGHLAIPAGFLRPEGSNDERGNSSLTNRIDRLNQGCLNSNSSLIVQYRLPTEEGPFKVQRLQLYLNSFLSTNGHLPTLPDNTSLYDWQSQNWVQIHNIVNNAHPYSNSYSSSSSQSQTPPLPTEIENPERFANAQTGLVLLRFDSTNSQTLQVQYNLGVQGTH